MAELLFEIGTEELPPGLIENLTFQITNNIKNKLNGNSISFNNESIETYNTPRRIAIYIKELPLVQDIKKVKVKGPTKEIAYDKNGNPTQALIGFARRYNLEPKDKNITTETINNIEYISAMTQTGGKDTKDILAQILPESLKQTTGEKFMSWANYEEKFARPVRWLLAIIDSEIIDFTYSGIKSSNYSFGHRFQPNNKVHITSPVKYKDLLRENHVIVCQKERKELIYSLIDKTSKEAKGYISANANNLIDTVVNITEYPNSLLCSFDKDFLSLPPSVIETVLEKHQKCFVLYKENKKDLISQFTVITNSLNSNQDQIRSGNEKVVRARLNDARFFYKEDLKTPFTYESRINSLSTITFQKGLGSMAKKVERIIKLSDLIFDMIEKQNKNIKCKKEDIINTAKLCKLDLTTKMVFEMPELQGTIGRIYAKNQGYPETIYTSIEEHYTNTSTNNIIAQIIGIADKLDNLICLFSINKIPTGSTDPFALRGQVQWIFNTIEIIQDQYNIMFKLSDIVDFFKDKIANEELKSKITIDILKKAKSFLTERLKLKYLASHCPLSDLIEATFSAGEPLNNIYLTRDRLKLLYSRFNNPQEEDKLFLMAAKRLVRIVEPNTNGNIENKLLTTNEEKLLLNKFENLDKKPNIAIEEYYLELRSLTNIINNFFDKILVNDPDPKLKQNRQVLLKKGKVLFEKICDFNQIVERH